MGASRIYVERPIFDRFSKAFAAAAAKLSSGDLRDPATMLGPIISGRQRARVRQHIDDARGKGAEILAGGEWTGHVCHATILSGVQPGMEVAAQETDRKSTRLNLESLMRISYAVFC